MRIEGDAAEHPGLGSVVRTVGDVDGDGLADLAVADTTVDVIHLVLGADLPEVTAGIQDVAAETWSAPGTTAACLAAAGDVDGDGAADWLFGHQGYSGAFDLEGAILAVSTGGAAGAVDDAAAVAEHSWVGGGTNTTLERECLSLDFDGDGRLDVWATHFEGGSLHRGRPIEGGALASGPRVDLPAGLDFGSSDDGVTKPCWAWSAGDQDGDGDEELLLFYVSPSRGASGFALVPGWPVPWGELGPG